MEGIFGILIPILALLFGLIGSRGGQEEKKMETPTPIPQPRREQQRPINTPSSGRSFEASPPERRQQETYAGSPQEMESAEDEFNKQMEMLKKDITSSQPISDFEGNKQDIDMKIKSRTRSKNNKQPKMSIKQSLTKNGIREAIIMSEVLAPPKTLVNKRNNRVN